MRSYEDRWNWLRAQLEDDAAVVEAMLDADNDSDSPAYRIRVGRYSGLRIALSRMDDADRNGPVEPL